MTKTYWKDTVKIKFLDINGHLTTDAISYLFNNNYKNLEHALRIIEAKGHGWWYDRTLSGPNIKYSGQIAFLVENLEVEEDPSYEMIET